MPLPKEILDRLHSNVESVKQSARKVTLDGMVLTKEQAKELNEAFDLAHESFLRTERMMGTHA
jgi:hypothetical protein